jgi:hypothetical protein
MPREKVQATVNPLGLPAYNGPTGVLEGHVYVEGDPAQDLPGLDFAACPEAKAMHGKNFREESLGGGPKRALLDAVVGITGYKDAYIPSRNEAVTVEVKRCSYSARTFVLTFGQRLDVLNLDIVSKDRFFAPDLAGAPANVLRIAAPRGDAVHLYPRAITRDRLIEKMNHTFMSADVFVAAQPLNTVTGTGGTYRIEGVPVGKLKVSVFHPAFRDLNAKKTDADAGLEAYGQTVEILAGKTTVFDATLRNAAN